ncbi:MAG: hypothetical protein JNM94_02615 [Phycisphaerae bacterium]|nr:hypothetical protein [Phycisphaerae bacterium]
METLLIGLLTGLVGTAYFLYGKRAEKPVALVAGAVLCVYPYFVSNAILSIVIGLVIAAVPFFVDV